MFLIPPLHDLLPIRLIRRFEAVSSFEGADLLACPESFLFLFVAHGRIWTYSISGRPGGFQGHHIATRRFVFFLFPCTQIGRGWSLFGSLSPQTVQGMLFSELFVHEPL